MDNLTFEKVWEDCDCFDIRVIGKSDYVQASQECCVNDIILSEFVDIVEEYMKDYSEERYYEFGNKIGNFNSAFSLKILPSDRTGHLKIEVDLEIEDNDSRAHRCMFYVSCELGQLERFGKSLKYLIDSEIGFTVSLT